MSRETLRGKVASWLWGYDYFISYHWKSGGSYADALADHLRKRKYDVFLDRVEYAMGDDFREVGRRALRNTKRLVLVATREAVTVSEPVAREVAAFTSRRRQIIPIVFGSADEAVPGAIAGLDRTTNRVLAHIPETRLYIREMPDRLQTGPSDEVINQLTRTYRLMRRREIRKAALGGFLVVLVAFGLFAVWSRNKAKDALNRATTAQVDAQKQKLEADLQAKVARVRKLANGSQDAAGVGDRLQALLLAATAVRHADPSDAIPGVFVPDAEKALRDALKPITGRALRGKFGGVSPDQRHIVTYFDTSPAGQQSPLGASIKVKSTFFLWSTTTLENTRQWEVGASTRDVVVSNARLAAVLALPNGTSEIRVWSLVNQDTPLTFPGARDIVALTDSSLVYSTTERFVDTSPGEFRVVKLPGPAPGAKTSEIKRYPFGSSYPQNRIWGWLPIKGGTRFLGIFAPQDMLEIWNLDSPEAPPRVVPLEGIVPTALSDDGLRVLCSRTNRFSPPIVMELPADASAGRTTPRDCSETLDSRRRTEIQWKGSEFAGGGRYVVTTVEQRREKKSPEFLLVWDLKPDHLAAPREYRLPGAECSLKSVVRRNWILAAGSGCNGDDHSSSLLIDLDRPDAKPDDSGRLPTQLPSPSPSPVKEAGQVAGLAISDDARWLAIGLANGRVQLRKATGRSDQPETDPDRGEALPPTLELTAPPSSSLQFVADRWVLAFDKNTPDVHVLEVDKPLQEREPRRIGTFVDDSEQGSTLIWPSRSSALFGWHKTNLGGEIIMRRDMASASFPATHLNAIGYNPFGVSPSGRWLAAGREAKVSCLFDLQSLTPGSPVVTLINPTKPFSSFNTTIFSTDERFVIFTNRWRAFGDASQWMLWTLEPPGRRGPLTLPGVLEPDKGLVPSSMGFDPAGKYLWAVRKDHTLAIFALMGTAPRPVSSAADRLVVEAVSDDGGLALLRDRFQSAFVFAPGRPDRLPRPLKGLDHPVIRVQTSRDLSRIVASSCYSEFSSDHSTSEVAISPDPVPSGSAKASAWDLTPDPPRRLTLCSEIGLIEDASISRDGRWLLANGERGSVVRDLSKDSLGELRSAANTNPSTERVIPEGRDYQLILDLGNLYQVDLASPTHESLVLATGVTKFAVEPSGDRVVTLGADGALNVHRLRAPGRSMSEQLQPLLDEAEAALGRNLTELEWTKYVPGIPYCKTFARLPGPVRSGD